MTMKANHRTSQDEMLLPALVAAQAAATPSAIAVVDAVAELTYAELDFRAGQVAAYLREMVGGRDRMVGVCLPRGVDLAVALLGVWKAGLGYVPLAPEQPKERLAWVLADTGAELVLTKQALAGMIRAAGTVPVSLDADWAEISAAVSAAPVDIDPDACAYVVHTSGSTGRPKGVVITHAGITNRVRWTVRSHVLGPGDRVLHKTSVTFDAACWEVFAPLVSGATVVMADPGAERDPARLVGLVAEHGITVLQVVPSVLRSLVDEPGWNGCTELRLVFSAGEPLHADLCQRLLDRVKVDIWNTYGPTECAIDVTAHRFDPAHEPGPVPIGRPIDNIRLLVLGPDGHPVPIGVPGELHVGGVGLARGYVNRPELTAEKFVPDPYGPPGARLYRTGDIVRWRVTGVLEYLHRADDQVKVNGVRVEPGEVEAALMAHPDVTTAAVRPFTDSAGATRLAAYLLERDMPQTEHLRRFLRDRLPEAMVPSVFLTLPAFPALPSGKIDRSALPAAQLGGESSRPAHRAASTVAERIVTEVWAELLGVTRVGLDDDFFQLGGSSLLATKLAGRLTAVTGADVPLPELFAAVTPAQQAELVAARHEAAPVRPVSRDHPLPLSFGQRRQWFLDRMQPGSVEWLAPLAIRLPARYGRVVVRQALDALVARHEVLRTRYPMQDGEPVQIADVDRPVELRVVAARDEQEIAAKFGEQFQRGFDLEHGHLVRAMLVLTGDEHNELLITMHHIACDGWSTVVLSEELRELCEAFLTGREPDLPELTLHYADFAVWQREQLTDAALERELAYWRGALDGVAPLELPADRPRPAHRDPAGALVPFTIPAPLADEVLALGRRHSATPFMTMLAAYGVLLSRYSGQDDFTVGTPVAGRTRPEVDRMVGFFLNSLVLRCDLAGEPEFTRLLARVRDVCRKGFAHQRVPFERLVDELAPDRDPARTPLFQVDFDLHEEGFTGVAADDDAMDMFLRTWQVAKSDLSLFLRRRADGAMTGAFGYATALFDHETVTRFAGNFVRLLEAIVATGGTAPVSGIGFIGPEERQLVLRDWSRDVRPHVTRRVHELFEDRVAQSPDTIAVVYEDRRMTYAELNARANQIAHRLRDLGAGPETLVAVCMHRGLDLVATLLGVLKSGAAYVPLDPSVPAERLRYILEDSGVGTVVLDTGRPELFTGFSRLTAVVLDEGLGDWPVTNPRSGGGTDDLCYVIYTSGSTGRPKGTGVTHGNVVRLFTVTEQQFGFDENDVWTLFHSYAFDFSVWELWGALLYGGRLIVVPYLVTRSPDEFLDLLVEQRVTVLNQTPSAFRGLVALAGDPRAKRLALRWVVFGGEKLEPAELNPWADQLGLDTPELVNMYGITETTVHVTAHRIRAEDLRPGTGSQVGHPLDDLRICLLDKHGNLVPIGAAGEIHVGGAGVTRGYLNRSALTAQRFVPDPFGDDVGARLYRSGDLARRRNDGSLEFLGRADDQVKIRGFRIELGEIGAVLAEHEAVRDAVVLTFTHTPGDVRLVAYWTPVAGMSGDHTEALFEHCGNRLPDYMVPAAFVELDRFPLTGNGKLDRAGLPAPAAARPDRDHVEPRNALEEIFVEILTELLGVRPGVHTGLFSIGGNSVTAVQLAARIYEELGISLPVRVVFERPTVAQLVAEVEQRMRSELEGLSDEELMTSLARQGEPGI
jgi:amino acid adenylation domain-containing protein